ncbi:hypothetical protein M378DRAFT_174262 [Amanita muscaria Koide BX008]|uniref:Uncharacterized protein n=1 Tax=Amanita muscaria (strain Koide BX008) TaxID=946122 RepID=A0A0C2VZX4_AMAMK|nr:hypothetical protein M378DRAFT_174262 [Amanita muscaria Koide BX008]
MSQAHSVFCIASFLSSERIAVVISGIQSNAVHEDLQWSLTLGWKSYIKHLVRDVGNVLRV